MDALRFLLKREFEERLMNVAKSTNTMALKQYVPIDTPSIRVPLKSPATTEASKELNIAKADKRGRIKNGVAFFMLKSIVPLSPKIITTKNSKILIMKIKGCRFFTSIIYLLILEDRPDL